MKSVGFGSQGLSFFFRKMGLRLLGILNRKPATQFLTVAYELIMKRF